MSRCRSGRRHGRGADDVAVASIVLMTTVVVAATVRIHERRVVDGLQGDGPDDIQAALSRCTAGSCEYNGCLEIHRNFPGCSGV